MQFPSPEKLLALGFVENKPAASTPAARHRFVRPRGMRPKTSRGVAQSTPSAPTSPTQRAEQLIKGLATSAEDEAALDRVLTALLQDLSEAADPMRALLNFARLCDAVPERAAFFQQLQDEPETRARLCKVLGWSQALADTIVRYPQYFGEEPGEISRPQLRCLALQTRSEYSTREEQLEALRRFRREHTLRIGLLDMERQSWRNVEDFRLVVRQISDLAQVCVQAALAVVAPEYSGSGFAVIAMGKFGARELNYSSDLDLIFLQNGELPNAADIGEILLRALNEAGSSGALYRVDMRLRPEGQSGPLVTPISYALNYYEAYAAAWEWQALIKARGVAGDAKLVRRFRRFTRSITWARRADDAHLREIVAMKKRSESTPEGSDPCNVKQGPGAIRDAEWVVQQLQMMVGPQHPSARASETLRAIERLNAFHALTFDEARELRSGYLFLRVLEHRLQLLDERAVRTLPESEAELAALARRMGTWLQANAAARWLREEHDRHRREIRRLCERLFWGWREAKDEGAEMKDEDPECSARLMRIAEGTKTHPLPAPLSRQIKAALPEALSQLEHAADPDRAVGNLERLSDASGNRLSLLRSLGGSPQLARAVFSILGGSQFLSDTLIRFPQLLDMAAQRPLLAQAKDAETARVECRSYCYTFRDRAAALRRWKAREFLRIGLRDLVLDVSPHEITREIAYLAQACLALACDEMGAALRPGSERISFAVIGMGKLGGAEMHYASDADVLFVYDTYEPFEQSAMLAAQWAEQLMAFMNTPSEEGTVFEVDARLRPHGRSGPLAPSVAAFAEYFDNSGGLAGWERQALTRARFVAGNIETAGRLLAAAGRVAFPEKWQPQWGDELRHIKHRVETERAAKSNLYKGEILDVKLGHGGLSDIEWCAQWLAMKHGAKIPALQTPNTLSQIGAAREAGVLQAVEANALVKAYTFLRRAELRLQVTQTGSASAVERGGKRFQAWARAVFPDEPTDVATARFEGEWQTHTTAARRVLERVREML